MVWSWCRFALFEFLNYGDWIFGGDCVSPDRYLNEYGEFIYLFHYLQQGSLISSSDSSYLHQVNEVMLYG